MNRFQVFACALWCVWWSNALAIEPSRPNIIVFYSDDHGYADLGIHGTHSDLKTPNLDALARSGVVAKHGYSTAPQCVPSRGGLMVGKFQGRFQLDNNGSSLDGFNKETTFPKRLQQAGYVTAQFGKWHLGPTAEITRHGFTYSFSQAAQRPFTANISIDGQDRPMGEMQPEAYHIDACSQAAAAIINRHHDRPFCLYIAYRAPHTPLDAPAKYTARFPGKMPERRRQALAMLSAIDDGVGLITRRLEHHGLREKSLIFFIGDNGAPLKIHKIDAPLDGDAGGWDGSLNTPLNGEKGMLSEGGMHVPFLVSWPGTIRPNSGYPHPISALDVAATAVAQAGVQVQPGDLDGVNLVPFMSGENSAAPHDALLWRWSAQSAIREGKWKLLRGGEREYLYDLSTDLEEKHNLASRHPDVAERLRARLKSWADELNPPGMALGPMAKAWTDYFDHYLDGKPAQPPSSAESTKASSSAANTGGWIARNGSLISEAGVLKLTPEKRGGKANGAFITRSGLDLQLPIKILLKTKSSIGGDAYVAWRTQSEKDFVPANRQMFKLTAGTEWQSHAIELANTGKVIHVRIHFPNQPVEIRDLEVLPAR